MFLGMSLSRRQFFRSLWNPGDRPSQERLDRYDVLETYVRTHLLPYDFSVTEAQEQALLAEIRSLLEQVPNDVLFSQDIRQRIEEIVESKIEPWRHANLDIVNTERIREIRNAAPDYVATFLSFQATPQAIDKLKQRFGITDLHELESELRDKIGTWIEELEDQKLKPYDIFSVKELVFAELRSWC